ncbi:IS982 family transposase [Colwellia maritima]|uniref:IS982 family transposase n=1 Tax=Colwellia maritima TaxID=2912588 RepID=UPI0030844061
MDRTVYNRRRRKLAFKIEFFRQKIASIVVPIEDYHVIDSMPLEVCKYSRSSRTKICQENTETSPSFDCCAAQKLHYFGYKIHAVYTVQGVIKTFDISKTSVHDINYLNDVKHQLNNCILIGDKGYLSQQYQQDLFESSNIKIETPMRNNNTNFKPFPKPLSKARKRIEILFSQLCDQFMIRRNYAKSFDRYSTRILSKITALTI